MKQLVVPLILSLAACKPTAPAAPVARAASLEAAGGHDAGPGLARSLFSATRCADCHTGIEPEWERSAHAHADASPAYHAMRARAGSAPRCATCHAPVAARAAPTDPVAHEAVTCQACHTISQVEVKPSGSAFDLRIDDNRMYGPLCDAKDHYFHRMGCSPLHATSELCAACHLLTQPGKDGAELPIFTEYSEWKASPAAARGASCQTCHMPGDDGEVAEGSAPRKGVPHHTFMGRAFELGEHAATLAVHPGCEKGRAAIAVELANAADGHDLPGGVPGKQLVLEVRAVDASGKERARAERTYARVLTDAAGKEVPFFAAVKQSADTRLGPGEHRTVTLALDAGCAGTIEARLFLRALSPGLAHDLGLPAPTEVQLASTHVAFPATHPPPRASNRAGEPAHP